ncbi:MAG: T9SS type A sorting domain-containing protein, partial [Saprospiraceae bacterium]|nr:T9SS type A sorting domain-containing protein [Saprospiraceae bacterium]
RNNGISLVQNTPCKCEIEDNELYIDDDETVPTAHGIRVDETLYGVPGDVYRIRNNYVELENAVGGIAAQSGRYLKLANNTVFMSDNISYTGIGLYASRQAAANCNVVEGPTTGSFTDTRGFYVNASLYPELGCNEVHATEYGIQFFGLNNGTALRGNTFGTHFYGLIVGQPLPNNTGITASIGTQSHHGNIWSQAAAGQGLQAFLVNPTFENTLQSQFIVDCDEGDNNQVDFCPTNNAVGTEWFFDEDNPSSSYFCATANACPQGVGYGGYIKQPDELDKRLAEGNFTASDFEDNQLWMGQSHLYARVSDGIVEVAPNSEIDSFVSANYNTTIGQFYRLEKSIDELLVPDADADSLIYLYDQAVAGYLGNMAVLDSLIYHAASSNDSLAYLEEKLATADTLAGVLALSDTLSAVTYADLLVIADSLQTRNQAIQTSEIYEENWKQVHHIFLETVAIGDLSLSDGQKDTLATIAGQCPLEGGEAVFAARALYELKMGNQLYDDSLLCAATRSLQRPNSANPLYIPYIYPNPNISGLAVVEIPGLKRDDLTAMVYNQYGVLVSTIPLQGSGDRYLLEVESLVPGVYFIQIRTQQEVLPATRFILAK